VFLRTEVTVWGIPGYRAITVCLGNPQPHLTAWGILLDDAITPTAQSLTSDVTGVISKGQRLTSGECTELLRYACVY
jgi:hypothetical protein